MSDETKHTPGPWTVHGPHDAPWVATVDCRTIMPQSVADARLIAAAPDLLAALVALVDATNTRSLAYDDAVTAIAKATGADAPTPTDARNLPARNELERESGRRGDPRPMFVCGDVDCLMCKP